MNTALSWPHPDSNIPGDRSRTMDRRDFLRISGLASAGAVLPGAISQAFAETPPSENWRIFEVTHRIEVAKPSGVTRAWVPTPLAWDTRFQKTLGNEFKAEGGEG